jgi:hypothetical protein
MDGAEPPGGAERPKATARDLWRSLTDRVEPQERGYAFWDAVPDLRQIPPVLG